MTERTGTRLRPLEWTAVAVSAVVILAAYSSFGRPLLYDEFVYFALGGLPTTGDALAAIRDTTTNLNQGVTGAYMLVEHWMLTLFGASTLAMRLPSLLSGAFLIVVSIAFLRLKQVGFAGLMAYLAILAGQTILMNYAGEARTYMPLAAATVGILAYYSLADAGRRTWWGRVLGWGSVLVGVLFHPYFALYWPAMLLFSWFTGQRDDRSLRGLMAFAHPVLVVAGAGVYVIVAMLTWARGKATAFVDPYNFLIRPLWVEILVPGLSFAWANRVIVALFGVSLVLLVVAVLRSASARQALPKALGAPLALLLLAWVLAALVSAASIAQDFWIFPRQWVASLALVPLALVWGGSRAWALARSSSPRLAMVGGTLLGIALLGAALVPLANQAGRLEEWASAAPVEGLPTRADLVTALTDDPSMLTAQGNDPAWQGFADANIAQGGPVWPEFAAYYQDIDWDDFVLTDGSKPVPVNGG